MAKIVWKTVSIAVVIVFSLLLSFGCDMLFPDGEDGDGDGDSDTFEFSVVEIVFTRDAVSGEITGLRFTFANDGGDDAVDVEYALYATTDAYIQEGIDIKIYAGTVSISSGAEKTVLVSLGDIDTYIAQNGITFPDGTFYIGAEIDTQDDFAEDNENNNTEITFESFRRSTTGSPTVSAGSDKIVAIGTGVSITAAASDPDGDTLSYQWSFLSRPSGSAATLSGATTLTVGFTPDVAGIYDLKITVSDGTNSAIDGVSVEAFASSTDTQNQAAALVDEAQTALSDMDYETAYTKFSQAVDTDPTYPEAILGYTMMDMVMIAIDPDVADMAQYNLGIEGYPTDFATLVDATWLDSLDMDGDGYTDIMFPTITDQSNFDLNDDLTIDFTERMIAAASFFATNNTGFNDVVETVSWTIGDRLDTAFGNIDGIPEDAQMVFGWDMVFATEQEALDAGWPSDSSGNAIDFVFGKAELRLISALLHMLRHQFYLALVWNYTLPLQDYWDSFGQDFIDDGAMDLSYLIDDDTTNTPPIPFLGDNNFLEGSVDARWYAESAGWEMQYLVWDMLDAIDAIRNRGTTSDFTLSEGQWANFETDTGVLWSDIDTELAFGEMYFMEIDDSFFYDQAAILPNMMDMFDYNGPIGFMDQWINNWPTVVDPYDPYYSMGINFYRLYTSAEIAMSALFEMRSTNDITLDDVGEPVFYYYDSSSSSFMEAITAPALDGTDPIYFVKLLDATLGGAIDTNSFPTDDPATKYWLAYMDDVGSEYDANEGYPWTFSDDNSNGVYDSGEYVDPITSIGFLGAIDGLIVLSDIDTSYGGDIFTYFGNPTFSDIDAVEFDWVVSDDDGDGDTSDEAAYLLSYLQHTDNTTTPDLIVTPVIIWDMSTDEIYGTSTQENAPWIWHSLTDEGDTATYDLDGDGTDDTLTSTGSFWWSFAVTW